MRIVNYRKMTDKKDFAKKLFRELNISAGSTMS